MSTFLPETRESYQSVSSYWNKFDEGKNKLRVLGPVAIGWEWWETVDGTRTPRRVKTKAEIPANVPMVGDDKAKHFWKVPVWNYQEGVIQVLTISQATIKSAIEALDANEEWGDPQSYDITIERKGSGLNDTEYHVTPSPKKEVSKEIKDALDKSNVNMDAIWVNENPFSSEAVNADSVTV